MIIDFGDFDLLSKHESAGISDGKRFQSVKKSGNDDFKQLIANQESKNTRRNTNGLNVPGMNGPHIMERGYSRFNRNECWRFEPFSVMFCVRM